MPEGRDVRGREASIRNRCESVSNASEWLRRRLESPESHPTHRARPNRAARARPRPMRLLGRDGRSQALATLRASSLQNGATGLALHARAKAVLAKSFDSAGLKCPLHRCGSSLSTRSWRVGYWKFDNCPEPRVESLRPSDPKRSGTAQATPKKRETDSNTVRTGLTGLTGADCTRAWGSTGQARDLTGQRAALSMRPGNAARPASRSAPGTAEAESQRRCLRSASPVLLCRQKHGNDVEGPRRCRTEPARAATGQI